MTYQPNLYPESLYDQLMELVGTNGDTFNFKDFELDGVIYRVFDYRLASYSDFLLDGALSCRGTMFVVSKTGEYIDIASRTPPKFFNLNENPFTMNLDLNNLAYVMEKMDGSIMSTYLHNGEIRLKSRGSIKSTQAIDAMEFLKSDPELIKEIHRLVAADMTVNFEWCSPNNQIVVGYTKPALVGLSIVDNTTGHILNALNILDDVGLIKLASIWVDEFEFDPNIGLEQTINDLVGCEGVVALTNDGVWFKLKSLWYLNLHRSKDGVNNTKSLIATILDGHSDDLLGLFSSDPLARAKIQAYQDKIFREYNRISANVDNHTKKYPDVDRKTFAVVSKIMLSPVEFVYAMLAYQGRPFAEKLRDHMVKHWRDYVITEFEVSLD